MKQKQRKVTEVLKELIDKFKSLQEDGQCHIMRCTACKVPECNDFTRSLYGYASKHLRAHGMVSD